MDKKRKVVSYALPYANGVLHLGHMLGMTQADCYVRASRLSGENIIFVCGDDAHGTPIMLNAKKQEVTPEALIADIYSSHVKDIEAFAISFDSYHTTHCDLNTQVVHKVYHALDKKSLIEVNAIEQAYDDVAKMFLPDRFIKGTCPKCGAEDQYGDHCEVCGKTYAIKELTSPKSVVSGGEPVWRPSDHYFFKLSLQQPLVENWLNTVNIQPSVKNKLQEWFDGGLQDWDVSRDQPYFGIQIPNTEDKYFYVWLDAPFGYMSSLGNALSLDTPEAVFDVWNTSTVEHFIGKDITYFHGIFWPAVLASAGLKTPDKVHVHGFLNVSGDKMSKSRGTFVPLSDCLERLPVDALRYYFASRLSDGVVDVELNWDDFVVKINSDLVGKMANIGSRSQGFIHKFYNSELGSEIDTHFWENLIRKDQEIQAAYQSVDLARACRLIMEMCDETNQYVDQYKPWVLAKTEEKEDLQKVCTTLLNAFRYLVYRLSPVVPGMAKTVADSFQEEVVWQTDPLLNKNILPFGHIVSRINEDQVDFR